MFVHLVRNAAALALATTAVACATAGYQPYAAPANSAAANLPGTPACFWQRDVNGWTVLNKSELIVQAPLAQDAYLVKLFEPVFDLDFHLAVGFQDVEHTGRICGPSGDYLVVRGYTPPRIPIIAVQRLTPTEQVQLLQANNKPVSKQLLRLASSEAASQPR